MQVDNKVAAVIIIVVVAALYFVMNGKADAQDAATESGNASAPSTGMIVSPFQFPMGEINWKLVIILGVLTLVIVYFVAGGNTEPSVPRQFGRQFINLR